MASTRKISMPSFNKESLGLSTHVKYDAFNPNSADATNARKSLASLDYSPLPRVTRTSFAMGVLVSMGGFVFGYDTGSISGFLAMPDFLRRFGQRNANGDFFFSNVRAGLIVGLVSPVDNGCRSKLTI